MVVSCEGATGRLYSTRRISESSMATEASSTPGNLIDEIVARVSVRDVDAATLAAQILDVAGNDEERRAEVVEAIGDTAHRLAPNDEPPSHRDGATIWAALLAAADALNGSGVHSLG